MIEMVGTASRAAETGPAPVRPFSGQPQTCDNGRGFHRGSDGDKNAFRSVASVEHLNCVRNVTMLIEPYRRRPAASVRLGHCAESRIPDEREQGAEKPRLR